MSRSQVVVVGNRVDFGSGIMGRIERASAGEVIIRFQARVRGLEEWPGYIGRTFPNGDLLAPFHPTTIMTYATSGSHLGQIIESVESQGPSMEEGGRW